MSPRGGGTPPATSPRSELETTGRDVEKDSETQPLSAAMVYGLLEKEGFKVTEATTQEDLVVHLWRKVEQTREQLQVRILKNKFWRLATPTSN